MKKLLTALTITSILLLLPSCEKKTENPFIGSWENSEITTYGSVVTTLTFRADMTMTFLMVVTVNDQSTPSITDYTYSFSDSQITVKAEGNPEETTDYMISGNSLVLSFGGMGLTTFTKI